MIKRDTNEDELEPAKAPARCECEGCGAVSPQQIFVVAGTQVCWQHRFFPESGPGQIHAKRKAFDASLKER